MEEILKYANQLGVIPKLAQSEGRPPPLNSSGEKMRVCTRVQFVYINSLEGIHL